GQRCLRFGAHVPACLAVAAAPLAMANDNRRRARVLQHGRGEIAREGAGACRVAVLSSHLDKRALDNRRGCVKQRRGGKDPHIGWTSRANPGLDRLDLSEIGAEAVHLPVTGGEQLWSVHVFPLLTQALANLILRADFYSLNYGSLR